MIIITSATSSYTYQVTYAKACKAHTTSYPLPAACPASTGAPAAVAVPETLRVLTYDVFGGRTTTNSTLNHDVVCGAGCARCCSGIAAYPVVQRAR